MHFWAFQKKEKTAKAEKINHSFFNNGWGFFIILWVCSFNFLFKINFSPFERTERVRSLLMHFLEKGLSEMRLKIHSFLAREIQSNSIRNAKLWPNKMKAFFFFARVNRVLFKREIQFFTVEALQVKSIPLKNDFFMLLSEPQSNFVSRDNRKPTIGKRKLGMVMVEIILMYKAHWKLSQRKQSR